MADNVEKLRAHGKVFHEMSERHLRHHYQDVQQQGLKQALLANALFGAADEIDQLRAVVRDMLAGLEYLRVTDSIPYGFGIDRLERTGRDALNIHERGGT